MREGRPGLIVEAAQFGRTRLRSLAPGVQFAQVGEGVLEPVPEQQLAPVPQMAPEAAYAAVPPPPPPPPPQQAPPPPQRGISVAGMPTFRASETPPNFVPAEVVGDPEAESDYGAVSRLVDKTAKQRATAALIALIEQVLPTTAVTLRLPPVRRFVTSADALVQEALFEDLPERSEARE